LVVAAILVFDVEQHRVEFLDALLRRLQLCHRALAALDHLAQAVFRGRVAAVEDVLLVLQDADDRVGLRQQFLQIAGQRHVAHPFRAHPLHALLGEQADEASP
jgi:hypothetical protein